MKEATASPVLIVGGSLNGLTMALLLARRGVPCLVVEKHPGTAIQYKFRGISARSMEIYRETGIEADIRERDSMRGQTGDVARMTNLSDSEVAWQGTPWSDMSDISSAPGATCDQDLLEPILRTHAERHGADIRFNTELLEFSQSSDGVIATVRDRDAARTYPIRAQYLIAADGSESFVRDALTIPCHGPGVLQHWMNVIFEAALPSVIHGRGLRSVFVTDINGTLVPRGDGRWLMALQFVPERGERAEDFTSERCRELIERASGLPNLDVTVLDARQWDAAARVADRYREERAFLVGDSAHVMPPTGGFGGNTGIQDAHNLAWKVEAVLKKIAGPELLASYDAERRPVADRTVEQALARLQAWFTDPSRRLPVPEPMLDDSTVIFGYGYQAGAFLNDEADGDRPRSAFEDPRAPSGRPGTRAPHLIVGDRAMRRSTVDVFGGQWVLVSGPRGRAWGDAALRSPEARRMGVIWHGFEPQGSLIDVSNRFTSAYKVDADDAVLIRPDGFIAWRSRGARGDATGELDSALERLAMKMPSAQAG